MDAADRSLLSPSQKTEPLRSAADDFPAELVSWLPCAMSSRFVQLVANEEEDCCLAVCDQARTNVVQALIGLLWSNEC